jgi:uncharacterized membrane protein
MGAGVSFFIWLEETPVSVWIRESPELFAFPFILYLHTLGLALVAGLSSAIALSILALPGQRLRPPLDRLFPFIWIGLAINVLSGIALLIAYPAKALTNPVFYIKLTAIAIAVAIVAWLQRQCLDGPAIAHWDGSVTLAASPARLKRAAWCLLGLWLVATVTGRLLAYTYSILLATFAEFA